MSLDHSSPPPLDGRIVLDASRFLPGAIVSRQLLDLGARVLKVEDTRTGDPLRTAPPFVRGESTSFATFFRGAESISLDLRDARDGQRFRALLAQADVLTESFRPGTMERWGFGPESLFEDNPALIVCSLSGFGRQGANATRLAHDLNLTAASGLLTLMTTGGDGENPRVQPADVVTGVLASSAILAALLRRERTGRGALIDQPLATGVLPLLSWAAAEVAGGGGGLNEAVLSGEAPCYRTYTCGDGLRLAAGTLEPKFWNGFCKLLGVDHLAESRDSVGAAGRAAGEEVQAILATRPRAHWIELAEEQLLPVSVVDTVEDALSPQGYMRQTGLAEETPLRGNSSFTAPGPYLPSLGRTPVKPAPQLGEHTDSILDEFKID